jgi:release factor glutamine methyltransferase
MTTIAAALQQSGRRLRDAAGEDARLEAEVLFAHVLNTDRTHVLARLGEEMPRDASTAADALVERRRSREPLAYIVGHREFYGIDIICSPAALIPRPETEMLVDQALEEIERRGPIRVVDVGTGSGAVAVAIAVNRPDVRVAATDVSDGALRLAARNARRHCVETRVAFDPGDLFAGIGEVDVVVANLPYVSQGDWQELAPEIRDHEPRAALVGGRVGTEVIERLIVAARDHLVAGGLLAAEIGETQAAALVAAARYVFPAAEAYVMKDFAARDRVLVVRREDEAGG